MNLPYRIRSKTDALPKKLAFLDIPEELRLSIFRALFTAYDRGDKQVHSIEPRYASIRAVESKSSRSSSRLVCSPLRLPRNSTAILRSCSTLSTEGCAILYSMYTIATTQIEDIQNHFLPEIGKFNASQLRSLSIRLQPERYHSTLEAVTSSLLDTICQSMPMLDRLTFWSKYQSGVVSAKYAYRPPYWTQAEIRDGAIQEQRHMMYLAAWITMRHPKLKLAVMSASRSRFVYGRGQRCVGYLSWAKVVLTPKRVSEEQMDVDMGRGDLGAHAFVDWEEGGFAGDQDVARGNLGDETEWMAVVLNSKAIRRRTYASFMGGVQARSKSADPLDMFTLPPTATTSEVEPKMLDFDLRCLSHALESVVVDEKPRLAVKDKRNGAQLEFVNNECRKRRKVT